MEINTPEDYVLRAWLDAEQGFKGPVTLEFVPVPPHPNEVATRKAVEDGVYDAEDVGLND